MEAIKRTIALLSRNTRLTTADHILTMLRANFGESRRSS